MVLFMNMLIIAAILAILPALEVLQNLSIVRARGAILHMIPLAMGFREERLSFDI